MINSQRLLRSLGWGVAFAFSAIAVGEHTPEFATAAPRTSQFTNTSPSELALLRKGIAPGVVLRLLSEPAIDGSTLEARVLREETADGLYVAASSPETGRVAILSNHSYQIKGYLHGLISPAGVGSDSAGNVYVADPGSGTIQEFAVGSRSPSTTYFRGLNDPIAVVTDSSKNVYAVDFNYGRSNGFIVEYAQGRNVPIRKYTVIGNPAGAVFDHYGNLLVDYSVDMSTSGRHILLGGIEKFAKGSRIGRATGVNFQTGPFGQLEEMAIDKADNLLVIDQYGGDIFIVPPPYDGAGVSSLGKFGFPYGLALSQNSDKLFITFPVLPYNVLVLSYPSGNILTSINSSGFYAPFGVLDLPAPSF